MNLPTDLSRRRFIGRACAAVGTTGMLSALAQLRMIGALAADAAPSDYKALVCLFLYGGNDSLNNLLIPTDNDELQPLLPPDRSRPGAAAGGPAADLAQELQRDVAGRGDCTRRWSRSRGSFAGGSLAIMANTGTARAAGHPGAVQGPARSPPVPSSSPTPTSRSSGRAASPTSLSSAAGAGGSPTSSTRSNSNPKISMSVTVAGQNSFQVGKTVTQRSPSTPAGRRSSAERPAGRSRPAAMRRSRASSICRSRTSSRRRSGARRRDPDRRHPVLLNSRPRLGAGRSRPPSPTQRHRLPDEDDRSDDRGRPAARACTRQVFFASLGGFDLALGPAPRPRHALSRQLSQGLNAFSAATTELGVQNQGTTFTASDFSRTFNTNGTSDGTAGSDHGWGSHHLVMGGAVKGGDIYGSVPLLELGGPEDTGRGRWIPTTSVDEYAATLATWFGVSASNLPVVFPNLGRLPGDVESRLHGASAAVRWAPWGRSAMGGWFGSALLAGVIGCRDPVHPAPRAAVAPKRGVTALRGRPAPPGGPRPARDVQAARPGRGV